jgi:hypothetical protein
MLNYRAGHKDKGTVFGLCPSDNGFIGVGATVNERASYAVAIQRERRS